MNLFLRAKHWQLFLFTFGLPLILEIILVANLMGNIITHISQNTDPTPGPFLAYFKILPVIILLSIGALFGWMFSIAIGLQKMLPDGVKMKTTLFKVFFFFPLVYLVLFCLFFVFIFESIQNAQTGSEPGPVVFIGFAIIFPLHLFAMFCIFYNINFVAKTIKMVELRRQVTFSDYIAEFFLVWFHFVGVWVLQPRINKLQENYENGIPPSPVNNFS